MLKISSIARQEHIAPLNLSNIKIIDVTFRDGGYRNNFDFDKSLMMNTIRLLSSSKIDFIEVGYKNGTLKRERFTGLTAHLKNEFLIKIAEIIPDKTCVMVHAQNIEKSDIKDLAESGVKMVRVCIDDNLSQVLKIIAELKSVGFFVTANMTRITMMSDDELRLMVRELDASDVDVIYAADSNGSALPDQIEKAFNIIYQNTSKKLGFHPHNNLHLALANTISAIKFGAEYIDTSITGIGYGAGNLPIEIFIGFLKRIGLGGKYDCTKIFEVSDSFKQSVPHSNLSLDSKEILMAAMDFPMNFRDKILDFAKNNDVSFYRAISMMKEF